MIRRILTLSLLTVFSASIALYASRQSKADSNQYHIFWQGYKYRIRSRVKIPNNMAVQGRYFIRNRIREMIMRKVSLNLENIFVDESRKVMDVLESNKLFRREYPVFLDSLKIESLTFRSNYVESLSSLQMRGKNGLLGKVPLPWNKLKYQSLEQSEYMGQAYQNPKAKMEYQDNTIPLAYTGLIIDLRGLQINRSLAPRIYSQTGRLLYGPEYLLKRIGTRRGIVGYVHSMEDPEVAIRAGKNPYFTVPLASKGRYSTDVVLSESDAARALEHPETLKNLLKCRVIFLIDK